MPLVRNSASAMRRDRAWILAFSTELIINRNVPDVGNAFLSNSIHNGPEIWVRISVSGVTARPGAEPAMGCGRTRWHLTFIQVWGEDTWATNVRGGAPLRRLPRRWVPH